MIRFGSIGFVPLFAALFLSTSASLTFAQAGEAEPKAVRTVSITADNGLFLLPRFDKLREMAPDDPFLDPDPSKMVRKVTIAMWKDRPGTELKLGADGSRYFSLDDGILTYKMLAHPNALRGDIIRVIIEAEPIGKHPVLEVRFGADAQLVPTRSTPVPLGDGWSRHEFTIVRPVAGEPMGVHFDMFEYSAGDVDVRLFEVHELGVRGDVNLDGRIDVHDAGFVLLNYGQSGNLRIEDGDTNLDGTVDMTDVANVIHAMENN